MAIAAINVAMNHTSKDPLKSLSAVIVTSTDELVRETFLFIQQIAVSRKGCKLLNTFGVLAVPNPSKGLLEMAETSFGILVCTAKSLARMLDNSRFSAKSPRLLVFDQGMSLASGSFKNDMERVTSWVNSKPTSNIQHLTIVVLSQLLDLELDLHRELHRYYMSTFLASKDVSTVSLDANPLAFFGGRAVPVECRYPIETRYKAFVNNIVNNHQSIICVDYSLERLGDLKRLAGRDGHKAEILDSRSPSAAKDTMDRFRAGKFNFLLTTFADVEGIKCVHANAVFLKKRTWGTKSCIWHSQSSQYMTLILSIVLYTSLVLGGHGVGMGKHLFASFNSTQIRNPNCVLRKAISPTIYRHYI
jgi:hypothetical protein